MRFDRNPRNYQHGLQRAASFCPLYLNCFKKLDIVPDKLFIFAPWWQTMTKLGISFRFDNAAIVFFFFSLVISQFYRFRDSSFDVSFYSFLYILCNLVRSPVFFCGCQPVNRGYYGNSVFLQRRLNSGVDSQGPIRFLQVLLCYVDTKTHNKSKPRPTKWNGLQTFPTFEQHNVVTI